MRDDVDKNTLLQLGIAKILADKVNKLRQVVKKIEGAELFQVHDSIVVGIPEGTSQEDRVRIAEAFNKL